jgi:hypothetical protein
MAIIRDQVEFLHVLDDVCGVASDSLGENFDCELSKKMVSRGKYQLNLIEMFIFSCRITITSFFLNVLNKILDVVLMKFMDRSVEILKKRRRNDYLYFRQMNVWNIVTMKLS